MDGCQPNMQQSIDERGVEKCMDEYLKSIGFHRKKIAKDGSCLFRAVAEQVLHCQSLHTKVRATCVQYLKKNKDNYEAFIEGDFEEYLIKLEDPQHWVGEVEINALALMYKSDFIIFQTPGKPPVQITDNGFNDKVRLCFLNGNHYDSVYPVSRVKNAALCQSVLYELLYERVCGTERSVVAPSLKGGTGNRGNDLLEDDPDNEQCRSSDESDVEGEDALWSQDGPAGPAAHRGHTTKSGGGRGQPLSNRVRRSLNPFLYRNTEYDVWVKSKRAQQKLDFCIAAGMQYTVGDKCKVRLDNGGRYYGAYIQEVSPDNGPVTVFIEELGRKRSVSLWNLRPPTDETTSWSTVTRDGKRLNNVSTPHPEWEGRGGGRRSGNPSPSETLPVSQAKGPSHSVGRGVHKQHSWPPQATVEEGGVRSTPHLNPRRPSSSTMSEAAAFGLSEAQRLARQEEQRDLALLEMELRDETSFPALGVVSNAREGKKRIGRGMRKSTGDEDQNLPPSFIPHGCTPPHFLPPPRPPPSSPLPSPPGSPQPPPLQPQTALHQLAHLYQDPLYPGFPLSDKEEIVQTPPYSYMHTGEDLPRDVNILRFFFNLGVKAFTNPMWPPHSYILPLHQAYSMQPKLPSVSLPLSHWYPSHSPAVTHTPPTSHPPTAPQEGYGHPHPQYPPSGLGGLHLHDHLQRPTLQSATEPPQHVEFRYGQDGRSALGYPSNLNAHPATTQPMPLQARMGVSIPWCSNVAPRPNTYTGICSIPIPKTQYPPPAPRPSPPNQYPPAPQPSTHTSQPQAQPYPPAPAATPHSPPSVPQYPSASLGYYPAPRLPSGNQSQTPLDPHPASGASCLGMRSRHSPLENRHANTTSVINITTEAAVTSLSSTAAYTERALQNVPAGFTDRGQGDMKTSGTLPPNEQENHDIGVSMATPSKTPPGSDPKQLERTGTVREIGSQAVWSLSSCKPGFGVDQLRDDNLETYWQSDGSQPHLVNIQFRRKTTVKMLCIYADYKSDESYTPSKISVRVGNNFHNLQEIRQLEMVEPSGWIHIPLLDTVNNPIRTFMIQIAVLANHQNGRDTHMRQIKVYTPVEESSIGKFPRCTTVDFMMYRTIR
ncbi:hypothetical protein J4Q44_G00374160 [Coregonus suidteri]|uniref:Anaphase-promoting complex subunit 10 n=1 Tax=Coregonus suidteri TaxID=861788 RepID=A0AAN8KFU8_9TELE